MLHGTAAPFAASAGVCIPHSLTLERSPCKGAGKCSWIEIGAEVPWKREEEKPLNEELRGRSHMMFCLSILPLHFTSSLHTTSPLITMFKIVALLAIVAVASAATFEISPMRLFTQVRGTSKFLFDRQTFLILFLCGLSLAQSSRPAANV